MQSVSVFPPKGDSTGSDLQVGVYHSFKKNGISLEQTPATFSPTSDYKLFPTPSYVVIDKAAEGANFVNMIGCFIAQLRIKDAFYDTTVNPTRKPYAALVDMGKCEQNGNNGESSLTTWYVNSTGPAGLGDGIYKSTAVFELSIGGGSSINMHVMLTNNITNGINMLSEMFFETDGGIMSGGVVLDFTDPSLTKVLTMQSQQGQITYFSSEFDPVTREGSAISEEIVVYQLQFNTNAYRRKIVGVSDTCVDFSLSSRILMADRYQLFNAADGSRVSMNTGVVIEKTVAGFADPLQVYIGYYGVWSMPAKNSNEELETDTFKYFANGDLVTKVDYEHPDSNDQYTLQKVNARLSKTVKGSITLGQLKGNTNFK